MAFGHRRYVRQLDAYVDDELPSRSLTDLEQHLRDCPECDDHVRLLIAMKNALGRRYRQPNHRTAKVTDRSTRPTY